MLKKTLIIAANLILMLLIVLGITLLWLPNWLNDQTGHGARVVVPTVVGQTATEAIETLEMAGLKPLVIDTIYSNEGLKPGEVIDQLPEGNLPVKPNRIVYLTINAYDVRQVIFPDVTQWSTRQAQSHLRELGFVADSVVYESYEFDDLVLRVTSLPGRRTMKIGESYPIMTRVVLHVGSTTVDINEGHNDAENLFK
ncbi:MAG: PASTA domain-containing protein [Bacteroidales bacterium]|nr:PASTA domain-containing protein [Bacteroidales bacterium]